MLPSLAASVHQKCPGTQIRRPSMLRENQPSASAAVPDSARRSMITSDQTHQLTLNLDPVGTENRGFHTAGLAASSAIDAPLRRNRFSVASSSNQGDDDLSRAGAVGIADDDCVTIENAGLDHGIAADFQRIMFTAPQTMLRAAPAMSLAYCSGCAEIGVPAAIRPMIGNRSELFSLLAATGLAAAGARRGTAAALDNAR